MNLGQPSYNKSAYPRGIFKVACQGGVSTALAVSTMDHLGRALLLAKLVVSSVTCIYIGAHGSIRRPPSAAPRKKGSRYGKGEEDRHIEGLTQSDAILFPVLAGTVLMGL